MNPTEYIKEVLKTESCDFDKVSNRLVSTEQKMRMLHAAMGMITESGELLDNLKKHFFYGKELDIVNLKEEVGDQTWYIAIMIHLLGTSFEEIMDLNIAKLRKRYPEGFSEEKALNRDIENELSHFEVK